ncbi:VanZ family protein [Planococcus wigleyi]|uniref:VanZ family protein n=1 Tax=Planococcus wigleyi TaxID=2762216 RepID=A0ABR8WBN9_9BACL|nr:VanZ family protein [Planococcus wigleyi]MBD8014338.1 VanZ family protein [Planococcus wigleyi]MBF6634209.1 VanZ family protein [Planococcus sp. (in: firmicutes)]
MNDSIIFTINSSSILLPLFLIFLIYLLVSTFFKRNYYGMGQFTLVLSFAIYLLSMLHLVIFPIEVNLGEYRNLTPWYKAANFIPILTIDVKTFVLNVIMLVPFGMYLPFLNRKIQSIKQAARLGFYVSLSFELTQLVIRILLGSGRSTDINDLIANTLGAVIGFLLIRKVSKISLAQSVFHKFSLEKRAGINR